MYVSYHEEGVEVFGCYWGHVYLEISFKAAKVWLSWPLRSSTCRSNPARVRISVVALVAVWDNAVTDRFEEEGGLIADATTLSASSISSCYQRSP
jgi:hypothetical protein